MRQHKLALCREHFLLWLPEQVERAIAHYEMFSPQERLLVAVSGGKDSLSLWDILWRLGYQADGLHICLGIEGEGGYSSLSRRLTEEFAAQRGLKLHIVDVAQAFGETVPEMAARTLRGKQKPCAVCGLTKRHIMNQVANQHGYHVLVTAHNLDDEAAVLLGNVMNWQVSHLARQHPLLEARPPGMVRKAKPLYRIYERETAAYALLSGISYIYNECPFSEGSKSLYYKEILNRMELDRPGAKLHFFLSFLQAKQNGLFTSQTDLDFARLHLCPSCGQPTTTPGECTFCRMVIKVSQP